MKPDIVLKKRVHKTSGDVSLLIPANIRDAIPNETSFFSVRLEGNDIVYSPLMLSPAAIVRQDTPAAGQV